MHVYVTIIFASYQLYDLLVFVFQSEIDYNQAVYKPVTSLLQLDCLDSTEKSIANLNKIKWLLSILKRCLLYYEFI